MTGTPDGTPGEVGGTPPEPGMMRLHGVWVHPREATAFLRQRDAERRAAQAAVDVEFWRIVRAQMLR